MPILTKLKKKNKFKWLNASSALLFCLCLIFSQTIKATAASCTNSLPISGQVSINDPSSYSLWVRYQTTTDTTIQIEIDNNCYDVQLNKTNADWAWTNKSTQGTSLTVPITSKNNYAVKLSGNEYIKLKSVFLLAVGEICSDGSTTPSGDGTNCETSGRNTGSGSGSMGNTMGNGTPIPPVVGSDPVSGNVTVPSLTDNNNVDKSVKLSAIQVNYYVDGKLYASQNPNKPTSLDTTKLSNGQHDLKMEVIDGYGNMTTYSSTFKTQNKKTFITALKQAFYYHKKMFDLVGLAVALISLGFIVYVVIRKRQHKLQQNQRHGVSKEYAEEFKPASNMLVERSVLILASLTGVTVLSVGIIIAASASNIANRFARLDVASAQLSTPAKKVLDTTDNQYYVAFDKLTSSTGGGSNSNPGSPPTPPVTTPPSSSDFPIIATPASLLSTWRLRIAADGGPANVSAEGAFRLICQPSHLSYDDPIVYPGVKGAAHMHVFFGNSLADANSTWNSLRTTGEGTCQGGPLNRSAYWAPALQNGAGKVVMPDYAVVYYKGEPTTVNLPRGLRYIAGFNMANPNQLYGAANPGVTGGSEFHPYWVCENNSLKSVGIPTCTNGRVGMIVIFPYCWNGSLDSADHRSHVVFPIRDANTGILACPSDHSQLLPRYTIGTWYTIQPGDDMSKWYLSSDRMTGAPVYPNGTTYHADWFGAWDQTILETWGQKCIREMRDCSAAIYGDGTQGKQPTPWYWNNPNRLVDPPPKP